MQQNKVIIYDIKSNSKQLALGTIFVLLSAILIPYVFQTSYAQSVSGPAPALKFFRIKGELDKVVIPRGQTQTIEVTTEDSKSHAPIAGAITRVSVAYPAGTPVLHFSGFTDSSGRTAISWHIEDNAPLDTYAVTADVFLQGYAEDSFTLNYAVVAHGVNDNHHHDNNDNHHDDNDDNDDNDHHHHHK
jgi:hypothetical protein